MVTSARPLYYLQPSVGATLAVARRGKSHHKKTTEGQASACPSVL